MESSSAYAFFSVICRNSSFTGAASCSVSASFVSSATFSSDSPSVLSCGVFSLLSCADAFSADARTEACGAAVILSARNAARNFFECILTSLLFDKVYL